MCLRGIGLGFGLGWDMVGISFGDGVGIRVVD